MRNGITQNDEKIILKDEKNTTFSVDNPSRTYDVQGFYDRVTVCRNKSRITSFVEFGGRKMYNMFKRKTSPNLNVILSVYYNALKHGIELSLDWLVLNKGKMIYDDSSSLADKEALNYLKEINACNKKIIELTDELNTLKQSKNQ